MAIAAAEPAPAAADGESRFDVQDSIADELHAVPGDFGAPAGEELGRRHPVA